MKLTEYYDSHRKCFGCQFRLKECKKRKHESTLQFAKRMTMLI